MSRVSSSASSLGVRAPIQAAASSIANAYAGVLLTHPGLFAGRPDVFSLNRLFDEAETAGRLFGHCLDGAWLHVGTPAAIGQAEARMAETRLAKPGAPAASTTA